MLKLPKIGSKIQNYSFNIKVIKNVVSVEIDFSKSNLKYSKAYFDLLTDTNYPQTNTIFKIINILLNAGNSNNIRFSFYSARSYMEFKCPNSVVNTVNSKFTCNAYKIN